MSYITSSIYHNWTKSEIKNIITGLDSKTGMNGRSLPIVLTTKLKYTLDYDPCNPHFEFCITRFNSPKTTESFVIDSIRHAYAHYIQHECNIHDLLCLNTEPSVHDDAWHFVCKQLNTTPLYKTKPNNTHFNITETNKTTFYKSSDISDENLLKYLIKWGQLPPVPSVSKRAETELKKSNRFWPIHSTVVHPKLGFGIIIETMCPCIDTQKIVVKFENNKTLTFRTSELLRVASDNVTTTAS